jgi:hypothetical protein
MLVIGIFLVGIAMATTALVTWHVATAKADRSTLATAKPPEQMLGTIQDAVGEPVPEVYWTLTEAITFIGLATSRRKIERLGLWRRIARSEENCNVERVFARAARQLD